MSLTVIKSRWILRIEKIMFLDVEGQEHQA